MKEEGTHRLGGLLGLCAAFQIFLHFVVEQCKAQFRRENGICFRDPYLPLVSVVTQQTDVLGNSRKEKDESAHTLALLGYVVVLQRATYWKDLAGGGRADWKDCTLEGTLEQGQSFQIIKEQQAL